MLSQQTIGTHLHGPPHRSPSWGDAISKDLHEVDARIVGDDDSPAMRSSESRNAWLGTASFVWPDETSSAFPASQTTQTVWAGQPFTCRTVQNSGDSSRDDENSETQTHGAFLR